MAGVDSAGIGEVVQNILAAFSGAERARLAQVNFTLRKRGLGLTFVRGCF